MPVAIILVVAPLAMETGVGAMLMPMSVAAVTVMLAAGEVTPLNAAVTVVVPGATPVVTPMFSAAITSLATDQVDMLVTSMTCPLENVPTAARLALAPVERVAEVGLIAMDVSVTGVAVLELLLPPQPESTMENKNSRLIPS